MSTVAAPVRVSAAPQAPAPYRFSVEQYHRMIETAVLTAHDRVELLEGQVVPKMAHNPPHDGTVTRVQRRLARAVSEEWVIRVQCSITTKESEPKPDIAVVRGPEELYFSRHPGPADIALVIEVSDSTLDDDREIKQRIYARARIPVYWIVNIPESRIEVYTAPRAGKAPAYRHRQDYDLTGTVPLLLGGTTVAQIAVRELLPPTA